MQYTYYTYLSPHARTLCISIDVYESVSFFIFVVLTLLFVPNYIPIIYVRDLSVLHVYA